MALIRVPKGNFTTIENSIFKDGRISLKAKGLFCYMLSKKDGWSFSAERISLDNNDGRDGVRAGLRELENNGYLTRVKVNGGGGLFTTEYHLNYPEIPTDDAITDDGKSVVGLSDDGKTNVGLPDDGKAVDNSKEEYSKDYINNTINSNEDYNNLFGADAQKEYSESSIDKNSSSEKEKSSDKKEIEKFGKTEFRQILIDIGAQAQHVEDWIKVRVAKRATFTHTALQAFFNECNKHNFPIPDAVRICAEKSWQGFKYEWILNDQNSNYGKTTITTSQSRQQRADDVAKVRDLAKQIIFSSSEQSNGCS